MKEIIILSGKGGSGKTIITSAFASLANNKVMVDCDVDAADLHLILNPVIKEKGIFKSGVTAEINKDLCRECGRCIRACRFNSISHDFIVDPLSCEGCHFCKIVCPADAITLHENKSGEWFISESRFGPFVHAELGIAEENSGKLIALIKEKAKNLAEKISADWIIVDGSPGIGCPVTSALTGASAAVIVIEATQSGLHDARRVIEVARHFKIPIFAIINKYDLNNQLTLEIESYCKDNNIILLGKIKFDKIVVESIVACQSIIEYSKENEVSKTISNIWEKLKTQI